MKKSVFIVCLSCCSTSVFAQENGLYLGLGIGLADVSSSLNGSSSASGLRVVEGGRLKISESKHYETEDDTLFSYHVLGGYKLNKTLSFELNAYNFGKGNVAQLTSKAFSDGSSSHNVPTPLELSTIAVTLSTLVSYSVNDRISLYTHIGGAWSQQKLTFEPEFTGIQIVNNSVKNLDIDTPSYTETESHFDVSYGFGTSIKLNESFESRVGITGIELKNGRIFDYGLSLIYQL